MPHKVNYGVDYEEDFYDYDDGYEYAETNGECPPNGECPSSPSQCFLSKGRAPETNTKQELVKVGMWRCSICTLDNRDSMNVCDICGNPKQEPVKAGVWRCPICTFDNEDTTNLCDMCGVLRNQLIKGCGGCKASADEFAKYSQYQESLKASSTPITAIAESGSYDEADYW